MCQSWNFECYVIFVLIFFFVYLLKLEIISYWSNKKTLTNKTLYLSVLNWFWGVEKKKDITNITYLIFEIKNSNFSKLVNQRMSYQEINWPIWNDFASMANPRSGHSSVVINDKGGFQLEFVSISRVWVISFVEITAFRLESKSCKGFMKKIHQ